MSPEQATAWRPQAIYAFPTDAAKAEALARRCNASLGAIDVRHFPDGESLVSISPQQARNKIVAVYCTLAQATARLFEVLLAASALRDYGAERLLLIAPYMPYMRQDSRFAEGQAVSQKVLGRMFGDAFDAFITVQPHLHRTTDLREVFGKPAFALSGARAVASHLRGRSRMGTILVGPDEESAGLVRDVAVRLDLPWTTAQKVRLGDTSVDLKLADAKVFAGHPAVIVDDMISSGGTIMALARALRAAGATEISTYAIHALFDAHAAGGMAASGIAEVITADSVPHPSNAMIVGDLIAESLGGRQ